MYERIEVTGVLPAGTTGALTIRTADGRMLHMDTTRTVGGDPMKALAEVSPGMAPRVLVEDGQIVAVGHHQPGMHRETGMLMEALGIDRDAVRHWALSTPIWTAIHSTGTTTHSIGEDCGKCAISAPEGLVTLSTLEYGYALADGFLTILQHDVPETMLPALGGGKLEEVVSIPELAGVDLTIHEAIAIPMGLALRILPEGGAIPFEED